MAELQLPKLATRVRFPSPAPNKNPFGFFFSAFRSGTSVRIWSPFRLRAKFSLSLRNLPSLPSSLFGRRLARFPSPAPNKNPFGFFFLLFAREPLFEFGRLFAPAQNSPFLSETCLRFFPPYSVGAWRVSLHPLHF